MTGLRLIFTALDGWQLDPTQVVDGLDATAQNCLATMVSTPGSNAFWPTLGTDLLKQGTQGLMYDQARAQHLLNFAAAETRELANQNRATEEPRLDSLQLQITTFAPPVLRVNVYATSSDGRVIGIDLTA